MTENDLYGPGVMEMPGLGAPILVPGIPRTFGPALRQFVDHSRRAAPGEAVGALLAAPDDWVAGTGWISRIVYRGLRNHAEDASAGSSAAAREFEISPTELLHFLDHMFQDRLVVVDRVLKANKWTPRTPWQKVVELSERTRLRSEWDQRNRGRGGPFRLTPDMEREIVERVEEELEILTTGFDGDVDWLRNTSPSGHGGYPASGLREAIPALRIVSGPPGKVLTAQQYLMITGTQALCGICHSHPGGTREISATDYIQTGVVAEWKVRAQCRMTSLGQNERSMLEMSINTGNWVFAFDGKGDGGIDGSWEEKGRDEGLLIRYNGIGPIGSWGGAF